MRAPDLLAVPRDQKPTSTPAAARPTTDPGWCTAPTPSSTNSGRSSGAATSTRNVKVSGHTGDHPTSPPAVSATHTFSASPGEVTPNPTARSRPASTDTHGPIDTARHDHPRHVPTDPVKSSTDPPAVGRSGNLTVTAGR